MPLLVCACVSPRTATRVAAPADSSVAQDAGFRLDAAWVESAPAGDSTRVYLSLANLGGAALPFVVLVGEDAEEVRLVADTGVQRLGLNGFHLPAGGAVRLDQREAHVELLGLRRALLAGERSALTLVLLNGMRFRVELEVRARDASPPPAPSAAPGLPSPEDRLS